MQRCRARARRNGQSAGTVGDGQEEGGPPRRNRPEAGGPGEKEAVGGGAEAAGALPGRVDRAGVTCRVRPARHARGTLRRTRRSRPSCQPSVSAFGPCGRTVSGARAETWAPKRRSSSPPGSRAIRQGTASSGRLRTKWRETSLSTRRIAWYGPRRRACRRRVNTPASRPSSPVARRWWTICRPTGRPMSPLSRTTKRGTAT